MSRPVIAAALSAGLLLVLTALVLGVGPVELVAVMLAAVAVVGVAAVPVALFLGWARRRGDLP